MVTAIVLIQASMGRTPDIADSLLQLPEVSEVYSVTGEYDLVAMVRVQHYDEMADAVPGKLARIDGIERTHTLMAFQCYSRRDLERMWGIGMESEPA
jgi:DNA-binding Lrp family transcriptional regulator